MRKFAKLATVAAVSALVNGTEAAQSHEHIQAGSLTCDISGGIGLIIGSERTLTCAFRPSPPGPVEFYAGNLTNPTFSTGDENREFSWGRAGICESIQGPTI